MAHQVNVVAYQVIVVDETELPPQAGFFKSLYSLHVPADTTSVSVPAEFPPRPGTEYGIEVLTIEASGNQTISSSVVATE